MKKILLFILIFLSAVLILIGASCGEKQPSVSPSEVVDIYIKSTLGGLPGANLDYELAKQHMTLEFRKEFIDASFVPISYCIQNGPDDIRIDSENISDNTAKVRVSGKYGDWQDMWEFGLVIQEKEWRIEKIICAPFPVVYNNSKYGFSFEYPETWYVLKDYDSEVIYLGSKNEDVDKAFINTQGARIEIYVLEWEGASSLEEWLGRSKVPGEPLKREEIEVAGYRALQDEHPPLRESQGNLINVYIAGDNQVIQVDYFGKDPDYYVEIRNLFRLLESFKFN